LNNRTAILISTAILTACGGGGGGGNASTPAAQISTPAPQVGFASGTFEPYQNFEQMCENPRSGVDSRGRAFRDVQGSTADENNWIRSWSNELYLWYTEITDVDPNSLGTEDYFDEMKTFATTPTGAPKDRFHFTIPTDEFLQQSQSGVSGGYGASFAFLSSSPPRQIVVAYTEPNTPASNPAVDLRRGASILEIDGVDLVNGSDVDTLNAGLFPGDNETHNFVIEEIDGTIREITMTSAQITTTPVQNVSVLETDTGNVGYLTFNDHIATAEAQLVAAVEQLQSSNITDLVLDLRYNGGGFLDIANELGFMIAGPDQALGRVFELLQFNDQHPNFDPVTGNALDPITFHNTGQGFSVSSDTLLPSLGLQRVFVLTGPGTCSASESIINGLRGIDIEVVQIGDTTCGKPYGFYPFDNCGTTYFSIQFRGVNDKNFGDYAAGFSPDNIPNAEGVPVTGCFVSDDFTRALGDPQEGRLRAALQYRADGTCPTTTSGARLRSFSAGKKLLNATEGKVVKPAWLMNRVL
jgi:hypothetical protein